MRAAVVVTLTLTLVACGGDDDEAAAPDAGGDARFAEGFASGWAGWDELGGVAEAAAVDGRGALRPTVTDYSLARMGHAVDAVDFDVRYDLAMTEPASSGVGFYVRQNGGYLAQSATHGAGYAVFVEGFQGPRIGLWHEQDGAELELVHVDLPALDAGAIYEVRFTCTQVGAQTELRAKLWPQGDAEPADWMVTVTDGDAALQDVRGGIAIDAWSIRTPAGGGESMAISVDAIDATVH